MLRLIFLVCTLWICGSVAAQSIAVKKSTDIVVIRGESYYLHTVQAGETLYSICKAYGADLDGVKRLNEKKDNALSLYEVLKVPYIEPFIQQDNKYYYHKVEAGETLYSISRRFDVKVKLILKNNEAYSHNEPLSVGAVVRLPLNEIDRSVLQREKTSQVAVKEAMPVQTKPLTPITPAGKIGAEKVTEKLKGVVPAIDRHEPVTEHEKKGMPDYISEVVMPDDPYVKIALLLPFGTKDYPMLSDTTNGSRYTTISSRSEQFLQFYEGILLSVDSLKNKGYKIDLHVYDTERDVEKMHEIAGELNQIKPDLIIGPVYASVFKVAVDDLSNKNIPLIYPLSSRRESFAAQPNFVQVNASFGTLAGKMADWIALQSLHANIIDISLSVHENDDELALTDMTEKKLFTNRIHQIKGINFFKWNFSEEPHAALKSLLSKDKENIIVLPTTKEAEVSKILPALSAYADHYKITVVGFPEWQTFTSVDHETYYKLNTKIFTYSYVDNSSVAARQFAADFRQYFSTEPGSLAYKAFDMGLYFIELAAKYRDRTLDAIEYYNKDGAFSKFHFERMKDEGGIENQGFFIVNYSSDYQLRIESL